ncbi:hypothetical protein PG994_015349 [Apiospora phragmitis]|uniref:Zn(2)-C6 fungal-type domain-containing protein n=1 Tax=Apiospora phragmitis TaxID=2905665 RepID=A0ABR1SRB7_9PEZI
MAYEPFHQGLWAKVREVNSHTFLNGLANFKQLTSHILIRIWSLGRPRPSDVVSQLSFRRTCSIFLQISHPTHQHPHSAGPHHPQLPPPKQYLLTPPHHRPFSRPDELLLNPVQAQLGERRQHEPDQFAQFQIDEHHQHSLECLILPPLRRLNSAGNAPDGLPITPYGMSHPNHQQEDHRRPRSFDDGPQYPQPPATYRPPGAYTPPSPIPVQLPGHYELQNNGGYGHHAPSPEVPYPAPVFIATAKRKAQRASKACNSCRRLKAKCDELKPCKNCKEKGIQCNYREPPVKQLDKVSADIFEGLQSLKAQITSMNTHLTTMESRVTISLKQMDNMIDKVLTNGG